MKFSPTPIWAMLATFLLSGAGGAVPMVQTAELPCSHHTIDARIPLGEVLFGLFVT